jgi:hypothetical protein
MKCIAFYVAIVLAALIPCTGAEAKRYHQDGKRTITKTVRLKHSTSVRRRQGRKHAHYAAHAGTRKRRQARHYSACRHQRRLASRKFWSDAHYQPVLWDGTLTPVHLQHPIYLYGYVTGAP